MDLFEFIFEGLKYVKKLEESGGQEYKKGKKGNDKFSLSYNYSIKTGDPGYMQVKNNKKLISNDKCISNNSEQLDDPIKKINREDIELFYYKGEQIIIINNESLKSFRPIVENGVIYLINDNQKIELPYNLHIEKSRIDSWQYNNGIMIIKINQTA